MEKSTVIKNKELSDVIDWVAEHEQAAKDFVQFFTPRAWFDEDGELKTNGIHLEEVEGWISEHDTLRVDYEAYFHKKL